MDERRKVMGGAQVRRLRADLGLSQSAMAIELGISVSYLNLVERNQRPLTAQLLIRLSQTYAVDAHAFAGGEAARDAADLEEVLADPVCRGLSVPRAELRAALDEAPTLVAVLKRLHGAYAALAELEPQGPATERGEAEGASAAGDAVERVRTFLEASANHFPGLEDAAEAARAGLGEGDLAAALAARLLLRHRVRVVVLPHADMGVTLRHYDRHRRRLMISELVEPPGRTFQTAYQLGLMEGGAAIDAVLAEADLPAPAIRLGRVALANYLAAAIVMPYAPFLQAAQSLAYDVDLLAARFGASWEQAAHRLTTLQRAGARGVPFFMIRVDQAGNVSKRFSSGAFPFSRRGGTCPRWSLHAAFANAGRTLTQVISLDGKAWLTVARTVRRAAQPWGEPDALFAVGLGCEARFAPQIAYGRGAGGVAPTEIGINCRLCDRPACLSRAAPSLRAPLEVVEATRGFSPFGG